MGVNIIPFIDIFCVCVPYSAVLYTCVGVC